MRVFKIFFFVIFLFCSLRIEAFAKKIDFKDLSIDEEISQVIMMAVDLHKIEKYKSLLQKGFIGGVLLQWGNYSLEETRHLVNKLQSWSKIPLLVAADYEGGITITPTTLGLANLPTNMMVGAADSEKDTATLFYLAGMELRRAGINVNFAPVLDVNTNMYNPIIGVRSFGSNPELVSRLGTAVIKGLQAAKIAAVAKHFPGHGDISVDTHKTLAATNMSLNKITDIHLMPFKSAIDADVMGIMTAHVIYTELDRYNIATFSKKTIGGLLKKELGFKGIVVSDSLDMEAATHNNSIYEGVIKALNAGVDLVIVRNANLEKVHAKLKQELAVGIKPSRLAEASAKIFSLKQKLGLFNGEEDKVPITDKAYQQVAQTLAKKAITLVRDRQKLIPFINKKTKNVPKVCTLFFSPPRFAQDLLRISKPFIEQGWLVTQYNARLIPRENDFNYGKDCIENSDLSIIGSFQWANKPYYAQVKTINKLLRIDKPIILLSLMSPFDVRFFLNAKTVLAIYGITPYSIEGAAQAILGKIKPEGKLPVKLLPFTKLSKSQENGDEK